MMTDVAATIAAATPTTMMIFAFAIASRRGDTMNPAGRTTLIPMIVYLPGKYRHSRDNPCCMKFINDKRRLLCLGNSNNIYDSNRSNSCSRGRRDAVYVLFTNLYKIFGTSNSPLPVAIVQKMP